MSDLQAAFTQAVADSKLAPVFLDRVPLAELGLPEEFNNPLQQLGQWQQLLGPGMPGLAPGLPTPRP